MHSSPPSVGGIFRERWLAWWRCIMHHPRHWRVRVRSSLHPSACCHSPLPPSFLFAETLVTLSPGRGGGQGVGWTYIYNICIFWDHLTLPQIVRTILAKLPEWGNPPQTQRRRPISISPRGEVTDARNFYLRAPTRD